MDNELKNIWKKHLKSDKFHQLENDLAALNKIATPINLKAKIINTTPKSYSLRYSLLPLSAICLLLFVFLNNQSPENYQVSMESAINSKENLELDSLVSFYLEDDNFNLTLSELSILEEEEK